MPIKGLTERRRLPRVGKIHLGIMAENAKGVKYPKAVDYFVFPAEHPQREELIKTFGEQPRELRIIFPLDDEEKFASQYYRCYSKTRGLICKGDGEIALRMIDTQTGAMADRDSEEVAMKEIPCEGRECPDYGLKCKELMNLQFMIPEISGMGVWQIDTGSVNTIRNINGALDLIRAVYGRVHMVPLILAMEQIEVTNPDDGKKKKVWVLNLRSTDKMVEAAIKARLEPLQLVAGMVEGEVLDDIDVPVPDDERPELVTPDHEGPAGEPIKEPMSQKESEELAKHLWPEDDVEPAIEQTITGTKSGDSQLDLDPSATQLNLDPSQPTLGELQAVMTECHWSTTQVEEVIKGVKKWEFTFFKALTSEQIGELMDHIQKNPK